LAQQIEQNRIEQKRLVDANQNLQRVIQDAQLQLAKDRQKYLVIPLPNRENSVNQMNTVKVRNKTN
jgi:formamidopyrimidine-DNA glycosylase